MRVLFGEHFQAAFHDQCARCVCHTLRLRKVGNSAKSVVADLVASKLRHQDQLVAALVHGSTALLSVADDVEKMLLANSDVDDIETFYQPYVSQLCEARCLVARASTASSLLTQGSCHLATSDGPLLYAP